MMELRGVAKLYGRQRVLGPIDLTIREQQTTVLLGPSGCGKSTILRLLIGLIAPDQGTVRVMQRPVPPPPDPFPRLQMGYVIQDGGLFPHLTARDNIALMARFLGTSEAVIKRRLSELVELTRFPTDALDRYPAQLSGGQRQRVALMRALMLEPVALLLDEPLGALDPLIRADLQEDLRRIFRSLGKTVVMVTHDLAEADYFADTIVLLRDGAIVQQGTLADLWRSPADDFVRRFIQAQRGPSLPREEQP
jgi:osmoprotectant transport system ATP-binding protein